MDATTINNVGEDPLKGRKTTRRRGHLKTEGEDAGSFLAQNIPPESNDENCGQVTGRWTARFLNYKDGGNGTQRDKDKCLNCMALSELKKRH